MIDLRIILSTICAIAIAIELLVYSARIVKFFRSYSILQDTKVIKKNNKMVVILTIVLKVIIGYCILSIEMDALLFTIILIGILVDVLKLRFFVQLEHSIDQLSSHRFQDYES